MTTIKASSGSKTRLITLSGIMAALTFILTAYLHIPTGSGYTHAGDGVIFLAASILPTPYAIAVGAIGGALADGLSGFLMWLPGTVVIKSLTALFFTNKKGKIINARNLLAIIPSLALCVCGYSLYEGIVISGEFSKAAIAAAFVQTPAYCIQTAASAALYIFCGKALDKLSVKC